MTWGTHCPLCGHTECQWTYAPMCDGKQRKKLRLPPPPSFKWWEFAARRANEKEAMARYDAYVQTQTPKEK